MCSILLIIIAYSSLSTAQEIDLYEPMYYQQAVEKGTRSRDGNPGPNYWQNQADYSIDVRLDTAAKKIHGKQHVTYYNQSPDTLNHLVLRLYQNMYKANARRNINLNPENIHEGVYLDTIVINDEGILFNDSVLTLRGTNLAIKLAKPLLPGENLQLQCAWSTPIPVEKEFRRIGYYKDNAWFIGYFYPQIAVYDDLNSFTSMKGWDFRLFHKGAQEFYNDFNNYEVTIEVPEGFYVWATGTLQNAEEVYKKPLYRKIQEARNSEKNVQLMGKNDLDKDMLKSNLWRYRADGVPDFAFGTAQNYLWDATSVSIGDKKVFTEVAYHPDAKLYPKVIDIARTSLQYASGKLPAIPYPYDHSITFNGNLGGGMEFPMIANNADTEDTTFLYTVTFHEIFHNYCPFMTGFNEKRYPFMDEGLTALFTGRYMRDVHDMDQYADRDRFGNLGNVMDVYEYYALQEDHQIINAYSSINQDNMFFQYYLKPAVAYELFMNMVGEQAFINAFHAFVERWKGKHPTPYDMFYTFNNVLGENYNWFWNAWFYQLGYPDLGLEFKQGELVVKRIGALPLPVKIEIAYNDGTTNTITRSMDEWKNGTKQIILELENEDEIKTIQLNTERIPDIDDHNHIIHVNR
jgi:DNA polymerase IIIc chi subunit